MRVRYIDINKNISYTCVVLSASDYNECEFKVIWCSSSYENKMSALWQLHPPKPQLQSPPFNSIKPTNTRLIQQVYKKHIEINTRPDVLSISVFLLLRLNILWLNICHCSRSSTLAVSNHSGSRWIISCLNYFHVN